MPNKPASSKTLCSCTHVPSTWRTVSLAHVTSFRSVVHRVRYYSTFGINSEVALEFGCHFHGSCEVLRMERNILSL